MSKKMNNKGITLAELLATIVVTSILTIMLMQILALTVKARTQMEVQNKLQTESYTIAEHIRNNVFQMEPQEIELVPGASDETIIRVKHLYDYTTDNDGNIVEDPSNPVTHDIIFNSTENNIYYDGVKLNSDNVVILADSTMHLEPVDDASCDFAVAPCSEGFIILTLNIQIVLADGTTFVSKEFITTILI